MSVLRVQVSEEYALNRPQVVSRGDDHRDRRERSVPGKVRERSVEDQEFRDEACKARQPERCKESQPHQSSVFGHDLGDATEAFDLSVVSSVVKKKKDEEEHRAD